MQDWKGSREVSAVQNWGFGDCELGNSMVQGCLCADCFVRGVDEDIS